MSDAEVDEFAGWEQSPAEIAEREYLAKVRGAWTTTQKIEAQTAPVEVCICGHFIQTTTSKTHMPLNNNRKYAECRIRTSAKCRCQMQGRAVLKVRPGLYSRFSRSARGMDRPHALTGAVLNLITAGEKFEWLVTECDLCGGPFQEMPRFYALDGAGAIQRPGQPTTEGFTLGMDTGWHTAICDTCDLHDMMFRDYRGYDFKKLYLPRLREEAER